MYYLVDFGFSPPLAVDQGTEEECNRTLEQLAQDEGWVDYKVLSEDAFKQTQY